MAMENHGAEVGKHPEMEEKSEASNLDRKMEKKKKKRRYSLIPRFGCMRLEDGVPVAEKSDSSRSFDVEAKDRTPTHLIVMINGIIGSAEDWSYVAKQFVKAYPGDVIVHCSEANSSFLTLDGIDVMGKRLANEVISVVERHPNLQKISFVGHSLGGLIARYAVAVLYQQDSERKSAEENGGVGFKSSIEEKTRATIAGLEPVNFITVATPHLGSRGHKQIPMLFGFHPMEKVAFHCSGIFGKTGKHLILKDNKHGKPPLLLQMSSDSDDLKFISALQSFRRRVAYANASSDYIVGWSTSSLRRRSELPKRRNLVKNEKYKYVFNEEPLKTASSEDTSSGTKVKRGKSSEMEETMLRGLTKMSWERVDVNFRKSIQRFLAHNTILVKTYCLNSHGAHVIRHMIDNFAL